jgi:hypothetical protein
MAEGVAFHLIRNTGITATLMAGGLQLKMKFAGSSNLSEDRLL